MNNYQKIKTIIESGHIAQIQCLNGAYYLCSSIVNNNISDKITGSIRISNHGNLNYCYDTLGESYESEEYFNNELGIKSITVYQKPLRYPKQGDLVQILDTFKDSPDYNKLSNDHKLLKGGPFKIVHIYPSGCGIHNPNTGTYFMFDYRCIAPRIEPLDTVSPSATDTASDKPTDEEIQNAIKILLKAHGVK